jgi:hypothetical protein
MGRRATTRGDPCTVVPCPFLAPLGGVVMHVPEDIPHRQRQWLQQLWGDHLVSVTGDGALRGPGQPEAADHDCQRQLPAVPPAVLPRLAPSGFGVNRGRWDFACQPMVLVPDAPVGAQGRTGDCRRVALRCPRQQPWDQRAAQTPDQRGPPRRQFCQTPFPGAPRGKTPVLRQ